MNNLDVPLLFNEIKNRQDIKIITDPPKKIDAGKTDSFEIKEGDSYKNQHLNIRYYVNNSSSEEEVGVVYKWDIGGKPHCPKDHPDDITEEVKHCPSWELDENWEYIFSPK